MNAAIRGESEEFGPDFQGIWTGRFLPVTTAMVVVMGLAAFDGMAVIAALPSIAADLGDVIFLPWVLTVYLGTSAVAVLIGGPVIDAIGVRRTFRIAGVWFLCSSAAVAVAPTMPVLVAVRVAHGFGGGLVMAVVLATVGIAYPAQLRRRAFAAVSMVWGVMSFGGPAVAGLLLSVGGWRFVFAIQLPLAALALAVGWSTLPGTRRRPTAISTDWAGVALISSIVALLLTAASQIGVRWPVAGAAAALAFVAGAVYWHHAGRVEEPILDRAHITRFPLAWVHLTAGLVLLAGMTVDNYLPLYVQLTRGRSVEFAAFSITFLSAGWTSGSFIFSRLLSHWRESAVILLGSALSVPSLLATGLLVATEQSLALILGTFVPVGLSIGLVSTASLTLMQASSEESEMGRVNAAHQFVRNLSFTLAVALGGTVILSVVKARVGEVDLVRDVLAGAELSVGPETMNAVGEGLAWAHVPSLAAAVGGLFVAISLIRRERA